MELSYIYAPVESDLLKVEAQLEASAESEFPHLASLLAHSLKSEGKRIRPALTLLSGRFYKYDLQTLIPMATALEILHTATLVHDDAIDHSLMRRNRPTINKLWGEQQAILLGDYLFAEAGFLTATTNNLRVVKLFASTLKTISTGELDQAVSAFNLRQSDEQYVRRIARKTATLFTTSTESGAVLSGAPESSIQALIDYGYNLGIGFQIVDDILDFVGSEAQLGKPTGSDMLQGTVTLPLMLLARRYPDDPKLRSLEKDRELFDDLGSVVDMIRNSATIINECYGVAKTYCDRASSFLDVLPRNDARESLAELSTYIVRRKR